MYANNENLNQREGLREAGENSSEYLPQNQDERTEQILSETAKARTIGIYGVRNKVMIGTKSDVQLAAVIQNRTQS